MTRDPRYLHLRPGDSPPTLDDSFFRVVVVIETDVSADWQAAISEWLVRSGCRYMMAWGLACSTWDDSVDYASLEIHSYDEISDDDHVMTTWHENEPLSEVFWFAELCAHHPTRELWTLILHISKRERREDMLREFAAARHS